MTWQVQVSAGGVHVLWCHVVRCLKYPRPVVTVRAAGRCGELICARAGQDGWRMVALEIMPDHGHLFLKAHPSNSPSQVASQFKGLTSRRLRADFSHLRSRLPTVWSRSYCAAAASVVPAKAVCRSTGTQNGRPGREEQPR